MKKTMLLLVMIIALSVVLTACGTGTAPTTDLKVDFTDFTFNPNNFIIPAGKEITFTATNSGSVVHEFIIMKLGTTVGDDFGAEDRPNIYWEVQVDSGGSVTTFFMAPEPGEYQVVCGTPGHFAAGMVASLTVAAP
jgi:uncharacterized cupredoxin-like copper-binding protein